MRHLSAVGVVVSAVLLDVDAARAGGSYLEPPSLADAVRAGKLPPLAARLPKVPRRIVLGKLGYKPGKYGGTLRLLMGGQRDLRMMTVYGYARLVGYNHGFKLVADILEDFKVEEGRIFTFRLREGHKWSDGRPFTSEDFRYYFEDVLSNKDLSPLGLPAAMLAGGKPPKFEVIDKLTVRYTWEKPNPNFLTALAGPRPLFICVPAHYLRQFHKLYADPKVLAAKVKAARVRAWTSLHQRKGRQYRNENPDLPSLDPWVAETPPPSSVFYFKRNPYYHRVDERGRQLPYVDKVRVTIGSNALIAAKTGSGDSDLQARYIRFDNYTFLKQAERRGVLKLHLWDHGQGSRIALFPNLNAKDPVWRKLFRDVRVRRALSLAVNRDELNQVIFYGLARPSANTVLPGSPLYKQKYAKSYSRFDLKEANRLLDEVGMKWGPDRLRRLSDGRRAEFVVAMAGESTEESDALALIADTWLKIGIKIYPRPTQRDLFRKRVFSGETLMSVWRGLGNGLPTPEMSPAELCPSTQTQLQWPAWGLFNQTAGRRGEPTALPKVMDLLHLYHQWTRARESQTRVTIWHKMLAIHADQVYTIGTVNATKQPVAYSPRLVNVPAKAVYSFHPNAFFGRYMPDAFWFRKKKK